MKTTTMYFTVNEYPYDSEYGHIGTICARSQDELEEKMSLALSEHFDVKKEEISLIDKKLNVDFNEVFNQQVWYIINGEQRLIEVVKTWIY